MAEHNVQLIPLTTGDIAFWIWIFGDGSDPFIIDFLASIFHAYPSAGTYDCTLVVLGIWGTFDQITIPVVIPDAWCFNWDFVGDGDGDFTLLTLVGSYVVDTGWVTGLNIGQNEIAIDRRFFPIPTLSKITHISVTFIVATPSPHPMLVSIVTTLSGADHELHQQSFTGEGVHTYEHDFDGTNVDGFYIGLADSDVVVTEYDSVITGYEIHGFGESPYGISNCPP